MFRRTVNILVIFGLIAGQWAAVPHVHAGLSADEQKEHDATPHFHVGGGHHSHRHSHSHGGHRHSHTPRTKVKQAQPNNDAGHTCGATHDDDAVYLAAEEQSPTIPAGKDRVRYSPHEVNVGLPSITILMNAWRLSNAAAWPPPEKSLDESDLYLTLRTLRI